MNRIGFVSTRVYGTDGVSLEVAKWAEILERMGHECFFITGKTDRDQERSHIIEEADFQHATIREINDKCFGHKYRSRATTDSIHEVSATIKDGLYQAMERFGLDWVIAQNSLTIPMNIPLGIALGEFLVETGLPCIAHHHDFVWERERFAVNAVDDYISGFFPPPRSEIQHVVINSVAGSEFSRRTGLPYRVIPNVMDFDTPPAPPNGYACDFRHQLGLAEEDIIILQPTRVVHRKGIEHSIELVRRLENPRCKLVITHGEDDEGPSYPRRVRQYAEMLGVDVIFAAEHICHCRGESESGCKMYSIWDAYQEADLIAYPSTYEGFGNAFLEAVYFKKPIFCNRYTIFRTDIEPCGFQTIGMDGYLTDDVLAAVEKVLDDPVHRQAMVEHNYEVARQHFSYKRVEQELQRILESPPPARCPS